MKKKLSLLLVSALILVFIQSCAPTNPHLTEAKISMNREDYQKAQKELAIVLEQQPGNVEAAYLEGYIHSKQENWPKMYESFKKVREIDPEYEKQNINIMSLKAFGLLRSTGINDKFNNAVKVMDIEPEKAEIVLMSALKDLQLANKLITDDFITKYIIATIHLQLKNMEKAAEMYKEAIKYADPEKDQQNLKGAYINLANIYKEKEEPEKALEYLNKVLEMEPANKEALLEIAKYYEEKKEFDKALPMYEKMIENDPDNIDVLFNQGILYKNKGDIAKAIENFEKIVELAPEDQEAKFFLTIFYNEDQKWQKIIDLIEPVFAEMDPEWQNKVRDYIQIALVKAGRAKDAKKYME